MSEGIFCVQHFFAWAYNYCTVLFIIPQLKNHYKIAYLISPQGQTLVFKGSSLDTIEKKNPLWTPLMKNQAQGCQLHAGLFNKFNLNICINIDIPFELNSPTLIMPHN